MKKFILVLMLAAVWGGQVSAQSSQESLKEYAVKNVGGGVYVMSDNGSACSEGEVLED